MASKLLRFRIALTLLTCALLFSGSLLISGCGGDEEETAPDGVTNDASQIDVPAAEETPVLPDTAPPSVNMGEVVPVTLSVLQFMPENAQLAVALPPVSGTIEKAMPILSVFSPEEEIREDLTEAFTEAAAELGVDADSYESLAEAMGIDPESPYAFFADFTVMAEAAAKAAEAAPAEAAEASAAPAESSADDAPAPEDGSELSEEDAAQLYLEAAGEPHWAAVVAVTDAAQAAASLERIAEDNEAIQAAAPGSEDVDGITITTRGDYGYFTTGRYLAFGNVNVLRGVAARVKAPATSRYGTEACLASQPDELVALVYGGRFLPLLKKILPVASAMNPGATTAATMELEVYEKMFDAEDEDPIVVTLSQSDALLELLVRVDTATHPGILEVSGPADPLRLARFLPEGTQALLSMRFNDAFKKQIMDGMTNAATASDNPDMAMQMQMGAQFITQLGDELTIGIAAGQGLPELYVLLGMAQPESTQGLLQMFLPMEPVGDTAEMIVNQIDTPIGMPVYLSFQSDHAIASNSEAGLRAAVGRFNAGETAKFFAEMDPPFDIDLPRYQATIISSEIVSTVLGMAAMFSPDAPSVAEFEPVTTAIRQIRTSKELSDGWVNGRVTFYLGDLEEAARLRESGTLEVTEESEDEDTPSEVPVSQ